VGVEGRGWREKGQGRWEFVSPAENLELNLSRMEAPKDLTLPGTEWYNSGHNCYIQKRVHPGRSEPVIGLVTHPSFPPYSLEK
jgi:hypothetical protein